MGAAGSGDFLDSAGADASGADADSLDPSADMRADFLQVRLPAPLRFVVGVAYVVANRRCFAAHFTASHIRRLRFLESEPFRVARPEHA